LIKVSHPINLTHVCQVGRSSIMSTGKWIASSASQPRVGLRAHGQVMKNFVGAHPVGDGFQGVCHAHRPQGWAPTGKWIASSASPPRGRWFSGRAPRPSPTGVGSYGEMDRFKCEPTPWAIAHTRPSHEAFRRSPPRGRWFSGRVSRPSPTGVGSYSDLVALLSPPHIAA
jgi:hypothetical protein